MRYREFEPKHAKQNKKVDEVLPALAAGAVRGAAAVGAAAAKGMKAVGTAVGGAAKNTLGSQKSATTQPGSQTAADQQQQAVPIKVGTLVPMANPIGRVKINKIEPHSVTLDTQSKLGMNLKVDPAELGNYMQTMQAKVQK